jgi:transketolase C-terminal domain/subunit
MKNQFEAITIEHHSIIGNLQRGCNIIDSILIRTRIPVKKKFINRSKFEASSAKSEMLFELSLKEEKRLEAIHKVTSKVKTSYALLSIWFISEEKEM